MNGEWAQSQHTNGFYTNPNSTSNSTSNANASAISNSISTSIATSNPATNTNHDPQPAANANTNGLLDASLFPAQSLDLTPFQNPQLQQRMHNAAGPATFQSPHPQYNLNSVIPSKRPRPTDDGAIASPRPAPALILSQSQQPGALQAFPAAQQHQNPYQHLHHVASSNPTPSPTLQDAHFRPPTAQLRMNASPSPFPGGQPGMGMGGMGVGVGMGVGMGMGMGTSMSPAPDANGSRVGTPHNAHFQMGGMGVMAPSSMSQPYSNFGGAPSMNSAQMQGMGTPQGLRLPQNLAQQADTNRAYQMRMMQQQQQALAANNYAVQQRHQMGMATPVGALGQQAAMGTPTRNPQQQQQPPPPQQSSQQAAALTLLKTVGMFMAQNNKPFDPHPVVEGRPLSLSSLWGLVMRQRGSDVVTAKGMWPGITAALGFQPQAIAQRLAPEIRAIYDKNLAPYEAHLWRERPSGHPRAGMANPMPPGQLQGANPNPQMSPPRPSSASVSELQQQQQQQQHQQQQRQQQQQHQHQQQQHMMRQQYLQQMQQRSQAPQNGHIIHSTPVQPNAQLPATNGWSTPQSDAGSVQRPGSTGPAKMVQTEPSPAVQHPSSMPPQTVRSERFPDGNSIAQSVTGAPSVDGHVQTAARDDHSPVYGPKCMTLSKDYGGATVHTINEVGLQIDMYKPTVPDLEEMGIVDIRALGLSLQSGIHAEVRYALDHLVKLSHEQRYFLVELGRSDDLVDVLMDFAEDQLEILCDGAPEVSDALDLMPYEDVMCKCRTEVEGLQDIPDFATHAYDLDRAADRLIAVTTILRNASFWPPNHVLLASEPVVKFLSSTIKAIGMRWHLLRSHANTQDLMKDVVVFLSNVADRIELTSRDDALSILHFLLAFAPQPSPTASSTCRFARYNPTLHRYLPPAVDALAKLLARDDPNRAHYRHIFAHDAAAQLHPHAPPHQQFELLTKSFALAISVIPDRGATRNLVHGANTEYRIAEARKPSLIQGMLAADILASLVPTSPTDAGLARAWFEADDGWAAALLRLSCSLSAQPTTAQQQQQQQQQAVAQRAGGPRGQPPPLLELVGFSLVTHRAFGMLFKLGAKTRSELMASSSSGAANGAGAKPGPPNGELGTDAEEADDTPPPKTNGTAGSGDEGARAQSGKRRGANADADADANESDEDAGEDEAERGRRLLMRAMADVLPQRETLMGALLTPNIDVLALKQLCDFAALER